MVMWKPFSNSTLHNAPDARIICDKFHIMRHFSKALDPVRREDYKRLSGKDRSYIKDQRYTLLFNAVVQRGESESGRTPGFEEATRCQLQAEYGLLVQRELWAVVGLQDRARCSCIF